MARGTNRSRATAFMAARMRWSVTLAVRIWVSTMLKRADSDIRATLEIWLRLIGRQRHARQPGLFRPPFRSRARVQEALPFWPAFCYSRQPLAGHFSASFVGATWRSGDAADCKSANPGS